MGYRPILLRLQREEFLKIQLSNFKFPFNLLLSVKLQGYSLEVQQLRYLIFVHHFKHDIASLFSFLIWTCIYVSNSDASFSWVVNIKEFAHPATETFSAVQTAGPTFFLAIAMFAFVFQVSALITEKELKLRQVLADFLFSLSNEDIRTIASLMGLCLTLCFIDRKWPWWVFMILHIGYHGSHGRELSHLFQLFSLFSLGWCFNLTFFCTTISQLCSSCFSFFNWIWYISEPI